MVRSRDDQEDDRGIARHDELQHDPQRAQSTRRSTSSMINTTTQGHVRHHDATVRSTSRHSTTPNRPTPPKPLHALEPKPEKTQHKLPNKNTARRQRARDLDVLVAREASDVLVGVEADAKGLGAVVTLERWLHRAPPHRSQARAPDAAWPLSLFSIPPIACPRLH
eukprot:3812591-Rhodomonas_salina.1